MFSQNRPLKWIALACLAAVPSAFVLAQENGEGMELPPGWSMEDMQACIEAGTPGDAQARLMKLAGTWTGTNEMRMAPGSEPISSPTKWMMTSFLDGRYLRLEVEGDMPGMGPFHGFGLAGYDNVTGEYVADWVDSMSTGIMRGTGELAEDGKTLSWTYEYACPVQKKPTTMREVMKMHSPTAMTVEMFCTDPKSGEEFQCMNVELTKK